MDIATVDPITLHPNAVVTIDLGGPNSAEDLNSKEQKNIPFRISDYDCKTVELLRPIVVFGEPAACDIRFTTAPAFCEGDCEKEGTTASETVLPAATTPRRMQSSGLHYAADARAVRQAQTDMQISAQLQSQFHASAQAAAANTFNHQLQLKFQESDELNKKLLKRLEQMDEAAKDKEK